MRTLAMCTALSICLAPASVSAADLATGDTCELTRALTVSAKDKGKGKKTKLKKGAVLEVVNLGKTWSEVASDAGSGFAKTKKLSKQCTAMAPAEEAAPVEAAADATAADVGDEAPTGDAARVGDAEGGAGDGGAEPIAGDAADTTGSEGPDAFEPDPEPEPEPEPDYASSDDTTLRVGGDVAFVLPLANWSDLSGIGIGALVKGEYRLPMLPELVVTGRIGYIYHLTKNEFFSTAELPILFGAKYFFLVPGLYGAIELGLINLSTTTSFLGNSITGSAMKFGATAGAGYELSDIGPGVIDLRAQLFLPSLGDAGDFLGLMVTAGYAIPLF